MSEPLTEAEWIQVTDHCQDKMWRLHNLYHIITETGDKVKFHPNWAQQDLLSELWYLNLIVKARQLGFTTLVDLYLLDDSLFNQNISGAIIADSKEKSVEIFREKVRFPYENLPFGLQTARFLETDTAQTVIFDNKSRVTVGVSVRGLTFQNLHVSELGRIAKFYPARAEEIRTGALNTVHAGQMIVIESTTEGREGLLYDLVNTARKTRDEGRELTPLDFKLHFYPWFLDSRYRLSDSDTANTALTEADERYFAGVEESMEVDLDPNQRAWYVAKRRTQGMMMKQEFPSTIDEPFEVSGEGKIYREEMEALRREGRLLPRIPVLPNVPVDAFFDIGGASNRKGADYMACWFVQRVLQENRLIRFRQESGRGIAWWTTYIKSHGYVIGKIYLPHDGGHKRLTQVDAGKSVEDLFYECGWLARDIEVLTRVENKWHDGVGQVRNIFPTLYIDRSTCESAPDSDDPEQTAQGGVNCLDNYKKVWNHQLGCWRDEPAHDGFSHGADALETFARSPVAHGGRRHTGTTSKKRRARSHMTA